MREARAQRHLPDDKRIDISSGIFMFGIFQKCIAYNDTKSSKNCHQWQQGASLRSNHFDEFTYSLRWKHILHFANIFYILMWDWGTEPSVLPGKSKNDSKQCAHHSNAEPHVNPHCYYAKTSEKPHNLKTRQTAGVNKCVGDCALAVNCSHLVNTFRPQIWYFRGH